MEMERRERTALKAVLAVVAVGALVFGAIRPRMARVGELEREIEELNDRVLAADRLIRRESQLREEVGRLQAKLAAQFRRDLPPEENPLLWAARAVAAIAADAGIDDPSVAEISRPVPAWAQPPDPRRRAADPDGAAAEGRRRTAAREEAQPRYRFAPFAVQMQFHVSFSEALLFLAALQADNPLLNVAQLSIHGDERAPETQRITLTLEWPRHVGALDARVKRLLEEAAEDRT